MILLISRAMRAEQMFELRKALPDDRRWSMRYLKNHCKAENTAFYTRLLSA
jgi:hypothetical protein